MQFDLMERLEKYPNGCSYKETTTSRNAAVKMAGKAAILRRRILEKLENMAPYGVSVDEMAAEIGESVLATRPRLSELAAEGLLERTGERRRNDSGMSAAVWRVK